MNIKALIKQIKTEEERNDNLLHMTANENRMSRLAKEYLSSSLAERYYFGGGNEEVVDFNPFMIRGIKSINEIVIAAERALIKMSGGKAVNLNLLSGIHAMISLIATVTKPGDVVMTIDPGKGGHFATNVILADLGRKCVYAPFDSSQKENTEEIIKFIKQNKIQYFYIDLMNYTQSINIEKIKKSLGKKITIIYDASHTLGLMLGGKFQSPIKEGADILCANTHKTFPGPHKGIIIYQDKSYGEQINSRMAGKFYSTVHSNLLISLCISILEMEAFGSNYVNQLIKNSLALSKALERRGLKIRKIDGQYSQNHQVHLFIDDSDRKDLYKRLLKNNISTNFNALSDNRHFMRLGTQELTRRGMKEAEMETIAGFLSDSIQKLEIGKKVLDFNNMYKDIHYSFDSEFYK